LTAGDFQKFISGFQVLNPELVICNLDSKIKLNFDLTIEKVEDMFLRRTKNRMLQLEPFYRFFLPGKKIKNMQLKTSVEQKTDYEKLVLK
jgi:DNA-directed RNA polymerase subunit alpha